MSKDNALLHALLNDKYSHFKSAIDKENVSKSVIAAAAMRRSIINVSLDKAYKLEIEFDGDLKLLFPTDVEIVD